MRGADLPAIGRGRKVGLLGGSFDPAHEGHLAISLAALRLFALDEVWWLVSPGNPLKTQGPAPLGERMVAARRIAGHPRIRVTDLESRLGTRFTADTLAAVTQRYRDVRFVWLMGADNLAQIHLWEDWRRIFERVPVGVLARPGQRISARLSRAAAVYRLSRLPGSASHALARQHPPAWCFVNFPMSEASSSAIRAAGRWHPGPREDAMSQGAPLKPPQGRV